MIDWTTELSPEETERLLDKAAIAIIRRGMAVPAILFLEMHKPLSFITSQALVVTHPLIAPMVGLENIQLASKLLMDRNNIEKLIRRIEDLANAGKTVKEG